MAVNLSPIWGAGAQLLDNSGNVLTGGKIYTYLAGTTTPATTYTSSNGNTANSNPIILNSAGRVPYEIWLTDSIEYKFVLKDSNDTLIGTWDNLVGINSNFINYYGQQEIQTATAGQTVFTLTEFEYEPNTGNLSVFVDGVNQYGPGAQYAFVETDANTVTFVSGLHVGASVKFTTTKLENPGVADASQVSYTYPDSNAVPESVESRLAQYVSVKDFGAVGDGVTDDTTAIQNAIDSVSTTGGSVYLPTGTYNISDTLVINTGVFTVGVILYGEGRNTIINQTGTNKDVIHFSTTQFLQNSGLRDLQITSSLTSGHCINIVYGCTTCFFTNVEMVQNNPVKAVIYGDWTSFGGGCYDTKFSGGSWYLNPSSTEAGVRIKTGGTFFNENLFENLRCYQASTAAYFKITAEAGTLYWLYNNTWKNINFETCLGGGFELSCANRYLIENCSFWDAGAAYTNTLIRFTSGSGYESEFNTISNVGRIGDSLAAFVNDIWIENGQDTLLINCYTQTADNPVYNLNNKRVTVIGSLFGTVNNNAGVIRLSAIDGLSFPNTVNGAPLNYYDQGTWTATLTGNSAPPSTPVTTTGAWTRIGRLVTVTASFQNVTTTGASGTVTVTGLPFTPSLSNFYIGPVSQTGFGSATLVAEASQGATQVIFRNSTTTGAITYGTGTGQYLSFTLTYSV